MKNKKGSLLLPENIMGAIIFVLCLIVISLLVYKIYQNYTNDESENARKFINSLGEKIDLVKSDGNIYTLNMQKFTGSEKWAVLGWSSNDAGAPDRCVSRSCICICNIGERGGVASTSFLSSCKQQTASCYLFDDFSSIVFHELESDSIIIGKYPHIRINNPLNEFKVNKNKDSITMSNRFDYVYDRRF